MPVQCALPMLIKNFLAFLFCHLLLYKYMRHNILYSDMLTIIRNTCIYIYMWMSYIALEQFSFWANSNGTKGQMRVLQHRAIRQYTKPLQHKAHTQQC